MSDMETEAYREGWVSINETPTHVRTWGGWIEDKISTDSLIVCITGNPGVTGFYSVFLSSLHQQTKLPVWVINHAGLEFPPESEKMKVESVKTHPHLYDLDGQIAHKLKFIQRFAGSDLKLYLIGHSVGAKMVTGLLKEPGMIPRVNQTYFLFPTLEYIAKAPFGKLHVKYGKYFLCVTLVLSWMMNWLPLSLKCWIIDKYMMIRGRGKPAKSIVDATVQLINPEAVRAALFLARDEMINIQELDLDVLHELGERVNCFYGTKDGWAPVWQSDDVKRQCPKATVTVLEPKFKHAFVISSSKEIADIVSQHIIATRDKQQ